LRVWRLWIWRPVEMPLEEEQSRNTFPLAFKTLCGNITFQNYSTSIHSILSLSGLQGRDWGNPWTTLQHYLRNIFWNEKNLPKKLIYLKSYYSNFCWHTAIYCQQWLCLWLI
jgi:hypothetical protein